jgi:hypothetical protein
MANPADRAELAELIEFLKKYDKAFKPAAYQERILELLDKGGRISFGSISGHRWYKGLITDFFACSKLQEMEVGDTFALASLDGIRVFKLTELRKLSCDAQDDVQGNRVYVTRRSE